MKAIEVLFAFLTAISNGQYKKAHELTSKTWSSLNKIDSLKDLGFPKDFTFEIDKVITDLPTESCYNVKIAAKGLAGETKIPLAKEAWPKKKNVAGDWGVDPTFIITLQEVKEVKQPPKKTEKQLMEEKLARAVAMIDEGKIEYADELLASIPVDMIPQVVTERLEKAKGKKEVPVPDTKEYAATLAKVEDMGIEIPEGSEPSLDDLKDMIFKEQEKAKEKKAPARKPAAKKPVAKTTKSKTTK